jgi:RNA ligase
VTQLHTVLDVDLLNRMKKQGYVKATQHPRKPLEILNYTPAAQFESVWNSVTLACRGLIWNFETGDIVARPFPKFFNLEQWGTTKLPGGPIRVYDKYDGSLGILYVAPNELPAIATRGSFTSPQAEWATMWFRNNALDYHWPRPGSTFLFEIIYPENRIVLDYRGFEGLVLLGEVEIESGRSHSLGHSPWPTIDAAVEYPFNTVQEVAASPPRENSEGYVVHFLRTDDRVKIKSEEYKRLHALITECSSYTIWQALRSGAKLDDLYDAVPDEFYRWVERTVQTLNHEYDKTHYAIWETFAAIKRELLRANTSLSNPWDAREYRKQFALRAREHLHTSALFALLDDGSIRDYIWKQIRPEYDRPFTSQGRAADAA